MYKLANMDAQDKTQCHQTVERREKNTMNDLALAVCSILFLFLLFHFEFEFIYCSHTYLYCAQLHGSIRSAYIR